MLRPVLLLVVGVASFPAVLAAQHAAASPVLDHPVVLAPAPPPASAAPHAPIRPQAEVSSAPRSPAAHSHTDPAPAKTSHRPPSTHLGSMPSERDADIPVPGLGFDFAHFAATHPNDTANSHHQQQELSFFFPYFGGLAYSPDVPAEENAEPSEARRVAEAQPAAEPPRHEEPAPESSRSRGETSSTESATAAADDVTPLSENQEYIFVRRDGTVFFAIAYTWDRDTLRYVTHEGLRQTSPRGSLDLVATRQFNEQRGLSFDPTT
jgi:hypothetical protein